MSEDKKQLKKKDFPVIQKPSQIAFEGRNTTSNEVFTSVETDFERTPYNFISGLQLSSYPHLTHENVQQKRGAHVTDVRKLGEVVQDGRRFAIHERFHQDDVPKAPRIHDRFLASDEEGNVFGATSFLKQDIHQPRDAETPQRGDNIDDPRRSKIHLGFKVLGPDEKHPPLSPRTRRRE
jgi:hypothetical protein